MSMKSEFEKLVGGLSAEQLAELRGTVESATEARDSISLDAIKPGMTVADKTRVREKIARLLPPR
jgi:hypothetical protein